MKITALLVLILPLTTCAQRGIFKSTDDFRNNILSYNSAAETGYKWNLHEVWSLPYITLHIGKANYILAKDSIYGYRNQEGIIYRYFRNIPYEILNPSESLLLYLQYTIKGKGASPTFSYYFSITANESILPLSVYNLKTAFRNDRILYELIDLHFKQDKDLLTYDPIYRFYSVNRLIQFASILRSHCSIKH